MGIPAGVILYMFNHICFDCRIEAEMRGKGTTGNKKPIYVNGLVKTMSCKIINKLVRW